VNADEIRSTSIENGAFFLREIAAQLAELNEHFRAVDENVFGAGVGKSAKAGKS
jgi:hypothetical protein